MHLANQDPPLDPSTDEARAWLNAELAKARYHAEPSLSERLTQWLRGLLDGTGGDGPDIPGWVLLAVLAVLAVVLIAILVRVVRTDRVVSRGRGSAGVLDGVTLTARELRDRAEAAAERGDWNAVTLDAYRALVVRSAERTLLDDAPSLTAVEAADSLARVFAGQAAPLRTAARAFDDVIYGHLPASRESALAVLALDRRIETSTPELARAGVRG